jgi:hypothetical protein
MKNHDNGVLTTDGTGSATGTMPGAHAALPPAFALWASGEDVRRHLGRQIANKALCPTATRTTPKAPTDSAAKTPGSGPE